MRMSCCNPTGSAPAYYTRTRCSITPHSPSWGTSVILRQRSASNSSIMWKLRGWWRSLDLQLDVCNQIPENITAECGYHSQCYTSCTSKNTFIGINGDGIGSCEGTVKSNPVSSIDCVVRTLCIVANRSLDLIHSLGLACQNVNNHPAICGKTKHFYLHKCVV